MGKFIWIAVGFMLILVFVPMLIIEKFGYAEKWNKIQNMKEEHIDSFIDELGKKEIREFAILNRDTSTIYLVEEEKEDMIKIPFVGWLDKGSVNYFKAEDLDNYMKTLNKVEEYELIRYSNKLRMYVSDVYISGEYKGSLKASGVDMNKDRESLDGSSISYLVKNIGGENGFRVVYKNDSLIGQENSSRDRDVGTIFIMTGVVLFIYGWVIMYLMYESEECEI